MITTSDRKELAKLILTTRDNKVIEKIKLLFISGTKTKENFVEKYNAEINEAVERIKNGKYYTQAQADSLLAEWTKE
ncbi:MAG TPA: hypothetical protein VNG53_11115 [Bacteroidia bacterium]|nr:hypothetical protein [Bacteroidia bacterium]